MNKQFFLNILRSKILVIFLITLPTILPFFNTKFFYTQDYIFIARLNQMNTALMDGSFPVRWSPDLRYGEPTFNFYAAFPYYIGSAIHRLGFNFIWVAKILFILSSFLSALAIYFFSEKLFGEKGAYISTFLYTYAPYRAVDLYVRGALSESWAFVFFPLIFHSSMLLSEKISLRRMSFLALSLSGLFLTHNVTTLMFLPFLGLWWIYLYLKTKKWKLILSILLSFILGLGAASSFLLPALFENKFIQTKYLVVGYFNFRAHFVALSQFFSTFWGYGSSVWGRSDGLSFQVGLGNWVVLVCVIALGIIHRKQRKSSGLLLVLGFGFVFSIFLQHNKSAFIWEAIPLMAFIQFPWRFLAISIFISSIIGGTLANHLMFKNKFVYFTLLIFVVFSSISYFRPKEYAEDNFFAKFLNTETMHKGTDLTKDYLPIWVQRTDDKNILNVPEAQSGKIEVLDFNKKTSFAKSNIRVLSDSEIIVPITYFPGWVILANGVNIVQEAPSDLGLIRFKLNKGDYKVEFKFIDTPVRIMGNIISATSILIVTILFIFRKIKFNA